MKQSTKDVIAIVLCVAALIIAGYFLCKDDGFQKKVDQILDCDSQMYAQCRKNLQGSDSHGL
jgi:hypothetical protein